MNKVTVVLEREVGVHHSRQRASRFIPGATRDTGISLQKLVLVSDEVDGRLQSRRRHNQFALMLELPSHHVTLSDSAAAFVPVVVETML